MVAGPASSWKFVHRHADADALNRLESPHWPNWCLESRVREGDFNCTRGYSVGVELVRRRLGGATLLMIGNSHDRMAHSWLCSAAGASIKQDAKFFNIQYGAQGCHFEGFGVAYYLNFGTGRPPYWKIPPSVGARRITSEHHLKVDAPLMALRILNTTSPDVVMVDSSTWDLAKWWVTCEAAPSQHQHLLPPPSPPPRTRLLPRLLRGARAAACAADGSKGVNYTGLERVPIWCDQELPQLFEWVRSTFNRSLLAYRTPPTTRYAEPGRSEASLEAMDACGRVVAQRLGFKLVDYHRVVDEDLALPASASADEAAARRAWAFPQLVNKPDADGKLRENPESNVVHPGLQQAMRYMDEALSLVDQTVHRHPHRPVSRDCE